MQPNNTVNNTSPAPAPMTTPMNPGGGDIVFKDKPKKKTGLIIGILFLVLLAAGGIGFGIWAYLDGNQKTSDLNSQISDLQNQLANQPEIDETVIDVEGNNNPVIKSTNSNEEYRVIFSSSNLANTLDTIKRLNISVKDGKIETCSINTSTGNGGFSPTNCTISGLEGDIYKIVEFGAGQDNSGNKVGFIMSDGKIKYFSLFDAVNNSNFNISDEVNIDGYIVDAIEITVGASDPNITGGGYGSTVFVLNDGSFVKYDESML